MLEYSEFKTLVSKRLQKSGIIIRKQYYNRVYRAVQNDKVLKKLKGRCSGKSAAIKYVNCFTTVFSQQILNVMSKTIDNLINHIQDIKTFPKVKFRIICRENLIELNPSISEFSKALHGIIDSVSTIADDLVTFHSDCVSSENNNFIKVQLPKVFIAEAHEKLRKSLEYIFSPLRSFMCDFTDNYGVICNTRTLATVVSLIDEPDIADEIFSTVDKFKIYIKRIDSMVNVMYFSVGPLELAKTKRILIEEAEKLCGMLLGKLIAEHRKMNEEICKEFEELKFKALHIPENTPDLFKLCDFMAQASRDFIAEMEVKLQKSVQILCFLIPVTTLDVDHLSLNRRAINWYTEIQPVFTKSNTLCEAAKSDFEDDIQMRINMLNDKIDQFVPDLSVLNEMGIAEESDESVKRMRSVISGIQELDKEIEEINFEERLFKFPETQFPKLQEIKETVLPFHSLLRLIVNWRRDHSIWLYGPFEYLNPTVVEEKTLKYLDEFSEMNKSFKAKFKSELGFNKPWKFSGIADDPDPKQQPAPLKLCWFVLKDLNTFKEFLPLVKCMCNQVLERRHWNEMSSIAGFDMMPNAGTNLSKIIDLDLTKDIDKYMIISISADREHALHQKLITMNAEWESIDFVITKTRETITFDNSQSIDNLLAEQLTAIYEMRSSYFVQVVKTDLDKFRAQLNRMKYFMDNLKYLQDRVNEILPAITSNLPVNGKLLTESELVISFRENLMEMALELANEPNFKSISTSSTLIARLDKSSELIELLSSDVNEYLDKLRESFNRFFFLSNFEIIQGFTSDVKFLILKCFSGVKSLIIDKSLSRISGVCGRYGEKLQFKSRVTFDPSCKGKESCLILLEREMRETLRDKIIVHCDFLIESSIDCPCQVAITVSRIDWTLKVHRCLMNNESLKIITEQLNDDLLKISTLMKNALERRNLLLFSELIKSILHQRDTVELLMVSRVNSPVSFEWWSQIKHFVIDEALQVQLMDVSIPYGYEYDSDPSEIIINPLTEKCFVNLLQTYRYHMFGLMIGASYSGKTEVVKCLAKILSIQFVEFHADNNETFFAFFQQITRGSVCSGAWVFLKNLNKLSIETLSIVTQHLSQISHNSNKQFQTLVSQRKTTSFICTSVNIDCSEYWKLPSSLKRVFRTVALVKPDLQEIIRVKLLSINFEDSNLLAKKLTSFQQLAATQFNNRSHNNFNNNRNITMVLKITKELKHLHPDFEESALLIRALIDVYVPQLIERDIITFQEIINDLFPNASLPAPNYNNFIAALEEACELKNLRPNDEFKLKCIQTMETMLLHSTVLIVGESFTGKSTILNIVAQVLGMAEDNGKRIRKVLCEVISPEAFACEQLYKVLFKMNQKFKANDESHDAFWIIFDDCLNFNWTQKISSILTEPRSLFFNSGEKIYLENATSLAFETSDLSNASPELVSHCAVVYFAEKIVDLSSYLSAWLSTSTIFEGFHKNFYDILKWSLELSVSFFIQHKSKSFIAVNMHLIKSILTLFQLFIDEAFKESPEKKQSSSWWHSAITMAAVYATSGIFHDEQVQKAFCLCFTSFWSGESHDELAKPDTLKIELNFPGEGFLLDYVYLFKGNGGWKNVSDLLKSEHINEANPGDELFIPTVETIRLMTVLEKHVNHNKPFILHGDIASGKTSCLRELCRKTASAVNIVNYANTAVSKDKNVKQFLYPKVKRVDKNNATFIDDFHLEDAAEDATLLQGLLRQHFELGFWYDSETLDKISTNNVTFSILLTTDNKQHSSQKLSPRLAKHFSIYGATSMTSDSIFRIFSNVLFTNLKKKQFAADVLNSVQSMIHTAIEVYSFCRDNLRPTPLKFHYFFTLHDLWRVTCGCSLILRESVENRSTFAKLIAHELLRNFQDCIVDKQHKESFFQVLRDSLDSNFKEAFEATFDHLPKTNNDSQITQESFNSLIFGNCWMDSSKKLSKYEETSNEELVKQAIAINLEQYNLECSDGKLDIEITRDIVWHLVRVCRVLSCSRGNLITISLPGRAKRLLIRLACYIEDHDLYEHLLPHSSSCHCEHWNARLKGILKNCGTTGRSTTLYLSDRQLKASHVRDIRSLLTTGKLPELFTREETIEIARATRIEAQSGDRNAEIDCDLVMSYFADNCIKNFHLILSFNGAEGAARGFFATGKCLVKYCTIDCHESWPSEVYEQIARRFLSQVNYPQATKGNLTKCLRYFSDSMSERHCGDYYKRSGRKVCSTISGYFRLIELYASLTGKRQSDLSRAIDKYTIALTKVDSISRQIEEMRQKLGVMRPELQLLSENAVAIDREIDIENLKVTRATALVKEDEAEASVKAAIASVLRKECEAELARAIPVLEDAVSALNTLKPADVTVVKTMKNPPDPIKLVMAAVCVMLQVPPDRTTNPLTGKKTVEYWGPSKRVLSDMNFLQSLRDYDKDSIPDEAMQLIKENYMSDTTFLPEVVAKASSAAEGLCKWVRAMVSYYDIAIVVAPKKEKLRLAQKECEEVEHYLNEKRETLAGFSKRLEELRSQLDKNLSRQTVLEEEIHCCEGKLRKAEILIESLKDKTDCWGDKCAKLKLLNDNVAGDVLMAAATMVYLTAFDSNYRKIVTMDWMERVKSFEIPISRDFDFPAFMSDASQETTPSTHVPIKVAAVFSQCRTWCLFIDPSSMARNWIKTLEGENNPRLSKVSDSNHMQVVREAMTNGWPVILDVSTRAKLNEDLLFSYITQRVECRDGKFFVHISGGDSFEYSSDFRIYMTTRQHNPAYSSYLFGKIVVINVSEPCRAIEKELLDIVVSREKPKAYDEYNNFVDRCNVNRSYRAREEDIILNILSNSDSSIFESNVPEEVHDASQRLRLIPVDDEALEQMRASLFLPYVKFSRFCAKIFNVLAMLSHLNPMYVHNLYWYKNLYVTAIDSSKKSCVIEKHVEYLRSKFVQVFHCKLFNGIFECDKLIVTFLLVARTELLEDYVSPGQLESLREFDLQLRQNNRNTMNFNRALEAVVRLRQIARENFNFVEASPLTVEQKIYRAYQESTCITPIILMISNNEELSSILVRAAERLGHDCTHKLEIIYDYHACNLAQSIGQSMDAGKWLFLQNFHLINRSDDYWMTELESCCEGFVNRKMSPDFRLWISTDANSPFSLSLLQRSIKVACCRGSTMRSNLHELYASSPVAQRDFFNSCPQSHGKFVKLIYKLAVFHCAVDARQNYSFGPLSWNVKCNFLPGDFNYSVAQLRNIIQNFQLDDNNYSQPIRSCAKVNYAGSMLDAEDRRRLEQLLDVLFDDSFIW